MTSIPSIAKSQTAGDAVLNSIYLELELVFRTLDFEIGVLEN